MAIYMKYGSTIKGEVTATGYADYIECDSMQMGVGRGFSAMSSGGISKRESTEPSISEITLTKTLDTTGPDLFKEITSGKGDTSVIIALTRTKSGAAGGVETYLQFTLTNTALSGYSMSSGGDRPTESLSLNFTKIEYKYISYDIKGSPTPKTVTHDLTTRGTS